MDPQGNIIVSSYPVTSDCQKHVKSLQLLCAAQSAVLDTQTVGDAGGQCGGDIPVTFLWRAKREEEDADSERLEMIAVTGDCRAMKKIDFNWLKLEMVLGVFALVGD